MGSAFSKRMQGVATRLLTKFGSTVSLIRTGDRVWDEDKAEYVPGGEQVIPLNAAPVPVNLAFGGVKGLQDNRSAVLSGDVIVRADGLVEPKQTDFVQFDGYRWSIINIEKKQVNDDAIAYFIQVRK